MKATVHLILLLFTSLLLFEVSAQDWCAASYAGPEPRTINTVAREKTEITIPVVVHVVYRNAEQQISQQQIQSQIDVLNEDFRALNADLDEVYFQFQSRVADMEINFVLATEDPAGQPTTGIVEVATEIDNLAQIVDGRRRLCYDDLGGSSAWCTTCYLNIWVADISFPGAAGKGIFPTEVASGEVPAEEDGVYIQYDRFGRGSEVEPPYDLGRTTTHEIGHYLNLLHLWGRELPPEDCPIAVCCGDPAYDDFVDDTPFQIATYLGQCPGPSANTCFMAPDENDNVQNFMGFSPDNCALMFTEGQKTRAWDAIQTYRSGFLQNDCLKSCVTNTEEASPALAPLFSLHNNGTSQVRWEALQAPLHWVLFSADGRTVDRGQVLWPGEVAWYPGTFAAGIYFLRVENGRQSQLFKVLIARN